MTNLKGHVGAQTLDHGNVIALLVMPVHLQLASLQLGQIDNQPAKPFGVSDWYQFLFERDLLQDSILYEEA
jgi:hypothetical protein